jgi:hypothetical protein
MNLKLKKIKQLSKIIEKQMKKLIENEYDY